MDAPTDGRIARSRAVSADLEDIFLQAPPPAAADAGGARVHRFAAVRTVGGRRVASWGAMMAAAFVGVAGGAVMTRTFERPAQAPAPIAALPVEVAAVAPPAPAATLVPTLETPPQVVQAVERAETPKPKPKPRPAVERSKPRRPAAQGGPCGESCSPAEVMAADRRLRAAYSRAVEAGVSRGTLVAYRNRWNGLRRYAVRQPRRMVSGYVLLANDLRREARLARRNT